MQISKPIEGEFRYANICKVQILADMCKYVQISANIYKYLQISVNIKPPPREKFAAGNCKCNNQLPFPLSVDLFL